ncbi:MAG TPA: hypothetical protein VGS01_02400 [Candidatus Limnocylindria bacterium]|jgi:hypothetical protein|nr:hypothetical protein [Candidatus Limnocylindria bacterium]
MTRDDSNWARPVKTLESNDRDGAINANVRGRRLNAANGGFGRLSQKTFSVRIGPDVTPQTVVGTWKARFGDFWPKGQRMFLPATGIAPGEVGLINASIPGAPTMATGVLVIYADDVSFSFMSPEGHPFAGPLTFSAQSDDSGVTVAQVQELTRASDPFWELAMMVPVLGERMQNDIWRATLRNLAKHFGVEATVESKIVVVDSHRQWRNAKNIWQNAAIRSGLSAPLRLIRRG